MQDLDFLLISDPKIWAMPVKECREPLVDLKDFQFTINSNRTGFFGKNTYAGFTKVRESVANKLLAAQKLLPRGFTFFFAEGHRPLSLQRQMFSDYCQHLAKMNSAWDDQKLKYEATKFVAPPENVPPHSTGGAIDITLLDAKGRELDMGSMLDAVPGDNENLNFTYAKQLPNYAKVNRQILIDALVSVGFVNYPAEWWHWSYGDKYWAYHAQQTHALYDSIE